MDFLTDSIRCVECGSIDPILYSDRDVCCDFILSPLLGSEEPVFRQYQFALYSGEIGLFCVRGCCDLLDHGDPHRCHR